MITLIKKNILTIFVFGLFLASISFFSLIITQKNYRSSADLLVTQTQSGFVDYYTLSKSADFLTNVLVSSVYSDKFLNEMATSNSIPTNFLPDDRINRLKTWKKAVQISKNPNLGLIHVEVFGNDPKEITQVSNSIISILTNKYSLFLGKGQELDVRVMNDPTWERNPSLTQVAMVVIGGFLIGCLLRFVRVYYKEENENAEIAV